VRWGFEKTAGQQGDRGGGAEFQAHVPAGLRRDAGGRTAVRHGAGGLVGHVRSAYICRGCWEEFPADSDMQVWLPTLSAPTGGSGSPNLGMMGKLAALGSTRPRPGTSGLFRKGKVIGSRTTWRGSIAGWGRRWGGCGWRSG
jgi:hypothetical protein